MRLLILAAHPDDAEYHAGGLMTRYRRRGDDVKMISVTNGNAGHHRLAGDELAARRARELAASASQIGAQSEVWNHDDGCLQATLELRWQIVAEIRQYHPDLVLTHRPNDYHPDHRAVGQSVQDASYLVTVPKLVPHVPALRRDPVVAYMYDGFTRPCSFQADIVFDVEPELDKILDMLACHQSQMFEWLPYNQGREHELPPGNDERRQWLRAMYGHRTQSIADRYRGQLLELYGERAPSIRYVEAYEISQYAGQLSPDQRERFFPA